SASGNTGVDLVEVIEAAGSHSRHVLDGRQRAVRVDDAHVPLAGDARLGGAGNHAHALDVLKPTVRGAVDGVMTHEPRSGAQQAAHWTAARNTDEICAASASMMVFWHVDPEHCSLLRSL